MSRRTRLMLVALVCAGALTAQAGCGAIGHTKAAPTPAATAAAATNANAATANAPTSDPSAQSGLGSIKDSGDIPEVCGLLSKDMVTRLTGKQITQIDKDGGEPGDTSRYCQWQLAGGQLAVFVSRTTKADFDVKNAEATPVSGIGQDAFQLAGHLYVLYGTVMLDVYARGDSDEKNLDVAKQTIAVLLPQV
jgi:hypothetical protein